MIVVSDTSIILNLAIIGRLDVLRMLYESVIIPQAVYDEIAVEGASQAGSAEVERADSIEVKSVTNRSMVISLESELDIGEAEAIVLAVETNADLLLIDERKGRIVARRLGVDHIGLLGVLIQAKHDGMIPAVAPVMDDLMTRAGFWIGKKLYDRVLQAANESE